MKFADILLLLFEVPVNNISVHVWAILFHAIVFANVAWGDRFFKKLILLTTGLLFCSWASRVQLQSPACQSLSVTLGFGTD